MLRVARALGVRLASRAAVIRPMSVRPWCDEGRVDIRDGRPEAESSRAALGCRSPFLDKFRLIV